MDIIRLDGLSSELSDRADSADSTAVIRPILVHWGLIPSSSIPFLFLILLGKKHSCVVHKYFELKTSDGLLALKFWERFGNPIMVRVLCLP